MRFMFLNDEIFLSGFELNDFNRFLNFIAKSWGKILPIYSRFMDERKKLYDSTVLISLLSHFSVWFEKDVTYINCLNWLHWTTTLWLIIEWWARQFEKKVTHNFIQTYIELEKKKKTVWKKAIETSALNCTKWSSTEKNKNE